MAQAGSSLQVANKEARVQPAVPLAPSEHPGHLSAIERLDHARRKWHPFFVALAF